MLRTKKRAILAGLALTVACLALLPAALTGSPTNSAPTADVGATPKATRLYFPGRLYLITLNKRSGGYSFPAALPPGTTVTCTFQPGNLSWNHVYYGREGTNFATFGFKANATAVGTISITIDDPTIPGVDVTLDPIPVQPMHVDPCQAWPDGAQFYADDKLSEMKE